MIFLSFESSCDETAIAIMGDDKTLYAHRIFSQIDIHQIYGGVVPEIAARSHLEHIKGLTKLALEDANLSLNDIDAIAVTAGPGLIGGLMVGVNFASSLADILEIPCYHVNHLEAHILSASIKENLSFPYLLLLASGGHCQMIAVENLGKYHIYGETLDDAAGELFDKAAQILDLPYPGGPSIERIAKNAKNSDEISLPRPLISKKNCDFSFSGLKSAFRRLVFNHADGLLDDAQKANFAAALQIAIADIFLSRLNNALSLFQSHYPNAPLNLAFVGGVASNLMIRRQMQNFAHAKNLNIIFPPPEFCTDNAAMIAWVAIGYHKMGFHDGIGNGKIYPRWAVTDLET